VNHILSQEVLQKLASVVFETPKEKNAAIQERVLFNLAVVFSFFRQLDQRPDICFFDVYFLNSRE